MKISVLGDGGWGTTLAILLSNKGYQVTLWSAFPKYAAYLDKRRINKNFLPGVKIPRSIIISSDLESAVERQDLVVIAIPSKFLRQVLKRIKRLSFSKNTIFVSTVKGIELGSLMRMSKVIKQELGSVRLAVLSGPTIAREVAFGVPTTAVVSSESRKICKQLQEVFFTNRFRIYTNYDLVGTELGGSLKNIVAIACGISDGLGFGANTKAALLSRGLAEISRLGKALGAKQRTFSGVSGLGDLVTTCVSLHSRNRSLGEQIGKGKTLKEIVAHTKTVAEGVTTTKSTYQLARKLRIDMPITKEIYSVLYKNKSPSRAVRDLMTRQKKGE